MNLIDALLLLICWVM